MMVTGGSINGVGGSGLGGGGLSTGGVSTGSGGADAVEPDAIGGGGTADGSGGAEADLSTGEGYCRDSRKNLVFLEEQAQPTDGKGLYDDYCGACHGADGSGGPTTRPITDTPAMNRTSEFESIVRTGEHLNEMDTRINYMPKWTEEELSKAEVQLMVDYILSIQ